MNEPRTLFGVLPDLNGNIYSPEVREQVEQTFENVDLSCCPALQGQVKESVNYLRKAASSTEQRDRREVTRVAEQFLWSEYSTDASDRGVETIIVHKGKRIPIRIKRALTIDERQRANDAAFKIEIDDNGKPSISKQDQAAYTKEVVLMGLKFWPFEYSPGNPVPINRKTINEMDGGLLDKIANRILGATEVDKAALAPFEKKSEEDSSKEEQPDLS